MSAILFFDTETTGLTLHPEAELRKQPRVIEFAAVLVDSETGEELGTHVTLCNPGIPLEAIITKITGLTDDALRDAPTFEQALPGIRAIMARADVLVAHNLPFDRDMLRHELRRAQATDFPWPRGMACTVGLYRGAWGRDMKLLELFEHVTGAPLVQTHRALDDVRALVACVLPDLQLLGEIA